MQFYIERNYSLLLKESIYIRIIKVAQPKLKVAHQKPSAGISGQYRASTLQKEFRIEQKYSLWPKESIYIRIIEFAHPKQKVAYIIEEKSLTKSSLHNQLGHNTEALMPET
jgi:hypothetical protein